MNMNWIIITIEENMKNALYHNYIIYIMMCNNK